MRKNSTGSSQPPTIPVWGIAVISGVSGMLLGGLAFLLCNPVAAFFGVELRYTFSSIGFRCVVAVVLSLLGVVPLAAIARVRDDWIGFLLGGPHLAVWGCAAFLAGGILRWGPPPGFLWPISAGFVLYGAVLQRMASYAALKSEPNPVPPSVRVTQDGLQVVRSDEILASLRWADVRKIVTYKHDLFSTDEICLGFLTASNADAWLEISEEWPGFLEATAKMEELFPSISKGWYNAIMVPAFERKETVLWEGD